nr:SHOCT domain-containing protein [uncultured Desulfobulbus sp.]
MGHFIGGGLVGGFLNILFLFLIIALVYKLFFANKSCAPKDRDIEDSLKILDVRLARGEIGEEEYQRLREILRKNEAGIH